MISTTTTTTTTTTSSVTPVTNVGEELEVVRVCNISPLSWNNLNFGGRCVTHTNGLPTEIVGVIFTKCLSNNDFTGFMAFSLSNAHNYCTMQKFVRERDITLLCPQLFILDAKKQGLEVDDEPCINNLEVFEFYRKLAKHVENSASPALLTLLTLPKDLTRRFLLDYANKEGIEVRIQPSRANQFLQHLDEIVVYKTCRIMITNAPVTETRNKTSIGLSMRVREVGFKGKPSVEAYLLLLISTQKVSELKVCLFGQNPITYGCSGSVAYEGEENDQQFDWSVGESAPGLIHVDGDGYSESRGAGGYRLMAGKRVCEQESDKGLCVSFFVNIATVLWNKLGF